MAGHALNPNHPGTCNHKIYGLKCDEYARLLQRADGACELCRTVPTRILSIDHDHAIKSGPSVRGLLCTKCNTHLGIVERGERPADAAVEDYLANAWHLPETIRLAEDAYVAKQALAIINQTVEFINERTDETFDKELLDLVAKGVGILLNAPKADLHRFIGNRLRRRSAHASNRTDGHTPGPSQTAGDRP